MKVATDFEILSSFAGRVDNISLPANQPNSLKPLFEAVSNAIHSVEERFGARTDHGEVVVTLFHQKRQKDLTYVGYSVQDNGVGFNETNFESFRTSDSRHKKSKGGKGVGRLLWLKTADSATVESRFEQDGEKHLRTFHFEAGEKFQVRKHELSADSSTQPVGTIVTINPINETFRSHFPKRRSTISAALIRHFLRILVGDHVPTILVQDDDGSDDLGEILKNSIIQEEPDDFLLALDGGLTSSAFIMKHMLIDKKLQDDEKGTNAIFLCAQARAVERHVIDNQIGMQLINGDRFYVAVAEGDLLDKAVNQERSAFTLDKGTMSELTGTLTERSKLFLAPFISEIRKEQAAKVEVILKESPFFRPVAPSPETFVEKKLALNERSDEQIYVALSRENRREIKRRDSEFKAVEKQPEHTELLEAKLEEYAKFATDVTKGHLESYVRHRKAILDVLNKYRSWRDPEKEGYVLERAVHALVCPLGGAADTLPYDKHNLWMLDERLAFYSYFVSDKKVKSFAIDSESGGEPDLAFFDAGLGFRRDERRDPVMLVEFKRPGKENYTDDDDPYRQLVRYIGDLQDKTVKDNAGNVVTSINDRTLFICYIVADLTAGLLKRLVGTPLIYPTPDGKGRYGYASDLSAYFEVIPYEKLFEDAYLRNEIFFKKLGLVE